ncbi:MAG: transposase [Thaumarchaeota archaeon]|nr:transposase [Nitrososphaerota archaeon]
MRPIKSIQFSYVASADLRSLFEDFRLMCNDAIRIAIKEKPKSRFGLQALAYLRLKEYGLHTHYILSACEVAFAAYRNKNRRSDPYVKRVFLKVTAQSYRLNHMILRIPTSPRNYIFLALKTSDYHLSLIDDPILKRGSVTITEQTVSLTFSKEITINEPLGHIGIDVNERNVTTSDTLGDTKVYDTSKVAEIKQRYREIRAKIGEKTKQDRRISQRLYAKYGKREKNRTVQALHCVSKEIVELAKRNHLGIVMEKLKGIRKLYRKGNGQGTSFRGRMNSWTFHEVQRQIEYKAGWEGIPVTYVSPRHTSRNCSKCGTSQRFEGRTAICPSCGKREDRDVNASKNIMMAALGRAAQPPGGGCEGEPRRQEKAGNPPSRGVEVGPGDEPKI